MEEVQPDRWVLQILRVKQGEQIDKGTSVAYTEIQPDRVNAVMAAGLGLSRPRAKKAKAVKATKPGA